MKDSRFRLNLTSSLALLFLAATIISSGCLDADFRLEQAIKEAIAQAQEGNTAAAVNKLESLQDKHPNNADIAEALAIAYTEHGNYLLASNYYQKSARLSPDKRHLLKLSAEGQIKAGRVEDAATRLEKYLETFPENGETWLQLGRIENDLHRQEKAIDALTRGLLLTSRETQKAEDHQILGGLYLELKDYAQADYYLNSALTLVEDQTTEGQVLAGLVESSVQQEDWDVADIFLKRIASTQPELLQTSEVKKLKESVEKIFSLRDENVESVVKLDTPKPDAPEEAKASTVNEPLGSPEEVVVDNEALPKSAVEFEDVESPVVTETEVIKEGSETLELNTSETPKQDDSATPVEDAEPNDDVAESEEPQANSEANVEEEDQGLSESISPEGVPSAVETAAITGELASPTPPAEDATEAVTDIEAEKTIESVEPVADAESASATAEVQPQDQNVQNESVAETENKDTVEPLPAENAGFSAEDAKRNPYVAPENEAELLLIQAQQAIADGDVPAAIRMSWDSINKRPDNPAGWFILSRAYSKYGQDLNAESAALEATRLNPKNKKIVMNYLGILQRSRGASRFHDELLKAYRNFSSDPDFVLALARSYARIKNDPQNSAALYRRFFDLAPEDPRIPEVRQEASYVD